MDKNFKVVNLYLATLQAIYTIHRHNHWTTKGSNFYGDHLLFQRLYEAAEANADLAAEKFIGLFGKGKVDFSMQNDLIHKIVKKYESMSGNPSEVSLIAEKQFLKLSKEMYDLFKESDIMTLGLDDMIMSVASKSEEAVYLLQQTLKK